VDRLQGLIPGPEGQYIAMLHGLLLNSQEKVEHQQAAIDEFQKQKQASERDYESRFQKFEDELHSHLQQIEELERLHIQQIEDLEQKVEESEDNARIGAKLKKMATRKIFRGTPTAKTLFMLANSIYPKASAEALSQMMPAILAAIFADLDLLEDFPVEAFANVSPSPSYIRHILSVQRQLQMKLVIDLVLKGVPIFAAFDNERPPQWQRLSC